jgi:hypothetical protein
MHYKSYLVSTGDNYAYGKTDVDHWSGFGGQKVGGFVDGSFVCVLKICLGTTKQPNKRKLQENNSFIKSCID